MDDIYTYAQREYLPAEPMPLPKVTVLRNAAIIIETILKALVFGAFIILKRLVYMFIPDAEKNIQDKVAVVTGSANGIGKSIAMELARYGCHIALVDIDYEAAVEAIKDLYVLGIKAIPYKADVSNYEEVVQLKEQVTKDLGTVDILVNNVGILPRVSLTEGNPEDINRIIQLNLTSHFWTIRVFIDDMIKKGSGHIVAVASTFALEASGREITYSATKYAVRGLMDGLNELSKLDKLNINVTTVFPPLVSTRKEYMDYFSAVNDKFTRLNPFYELVKATPDEVAERTVSGILKNKKHVIIPAYLGLFFKIFALLPRELQELMRDYYKPAIDLKTNKDD